MSKKYTTWCRHCYTTFEADRPDAVFCTPAHAAAYARNHGEYRTRYHEEKPNEHYENCAWCGAGFVYNDYAQRGGKRKAQYCSNKHRQAAYRARKGSGAGFTGNWDDARNDKRGEDQKKKDTSREEPKKDTSQKKEEPKKDTSPKWWRNSNRYQVLGVTYLFTYKQAKAAYMALVKKYHPDVSTDPDANEIMQYVNAAWDYVKTGKWAG